MLACVHVWIPLPVYVHMSVFYVSLSVGDLLPGAMSLCAVSVRDFILRSETPFAAKFHSS